MNNKLNKIIQQAISYHQKGDLKNAEKYYKKIISLNPNLSDSYANLGLIYQSKNSLEEAKSYYKKAIYRNTPNIDIYNRLGYIYQKEKNIIEATKYYKKSLDINPNQFGVYINLGNMNKDNSNLENAEKYYKQAININPNFPDTYYNLGNLYKNTKKINEAKRCYEKVILLNHNHFQAYSAIASIYQDEENIEKAIEYYKKSLEINPKQIEVLNNIASLYQDIYELENTKIFYLKSLEINEQQVEILNNLGKSYKDINEIEIAYSYYQKALKLNSEKKLDIFYNIALYYLIKQNYKIGFDKYRFRYHKDRDVKYVNTSILDRETLLNSLNNIKDKTILITREQGFGDLIQFVRFLPKFVDLGAKIICETAPELIKLFEYNYPQIEFIDNLEEDIKYDYNFPMLDSAYLLNLTYDTIPYSAGYLTIDRGEAEAITSNNTIKIGINWQGSKWHKNDKNRSIKLELLLKYLDKLDNKFEIYSLQYEKTLEEEKLLKDYDIIDLSSKIRDFYDTSLMIDNMDIIISVDTSMVHLAGAMNKKVYMLLPFAPDWRWGLDDDKTNWYDSVTLFRQEEMGDWESSLNNLISTLNLLYEDLKCQEN